MKKKIDVDDLMQARQIHVLTVTETWHEDANCLMIKRLHSLGYNFVEAVRIL